MSPFGHPTQVTKQVQLTCVHFGLLDLFGQGVSKDKRNIIALHTCFYEHQQTLS